MIRTVRNAYALHARECRGPDAVRDFYIEQAREQVFSVMEQTAQLLQNVHSLTYMGFRTDFGRGLPPAIDLTHELDKSDDEAAVKAMICFK